MKAIANQNIGVTELVETFKKHRDHIANNGQLTQRRTERTKNEMLDLLSSNIGSYITRNIVDTGKLDKMVEEIKAHTTDPYTVVGEILQDMLK